MNSEQDGRVALIREIIERFGGRRSGSEAEQKAQEFLLGKMKAVAPNAQLQTFRDAVNAKFGSLKWITLIFLISLGVIHFFPIIGVVLGVGNGVLFVWHFLLYGDVLDPIWPKKQVSNVYATLEPKQEATTTIWVTGHVDSVREFQWWYRLKSVGMFLTLLGGLAFSLWGIFCLIYAIWSVSYTHLTLPTIYSV